MNKIISLSPVPERMQSARERKKRAKSFRVSSTFERRVRERKELIRETEAALTRINLIAERIRDHNLTGRETLRFERGFLDKVSSELGGGNLAHKVVRILEYMLQ